MGFNNIMWFNVNKWYVKIGDKKEEKFCMFKKIISWW